MCRPTLFRLSLLLISLALLAIPGVAAQGTSGSLVGTVTDPTGAVVPDAVVQLLNPVSGYERTTKTDAAGTFHFYNVPYNPYRIIIKKPGFNTATRPVEITNGVPVTVSIPLGVEASATSVTVETGSDLVENDPTAHTDVDRNIINRLPLESQSSSLSSLVTLASPGVAADSNGLFHGLGDHAQNSFSLDGQPITDQQSKVFSNQIPTEAVQSLTVISGAPTAEFGDKTSLVIVATTRSGQGVTTPHGSVYTSYGTFGSVDGGGDLSYGGAKWGNFIAVSGLNTGRFLDGPEFTVIHSKGNQQNIFDRVDYAFSDTHSIHTNLQYTRSWFQTPNSFDTSAVFDQFGNPVGPTDQRSKIETFNIAPTYTAVLNKNSIFNFGAFVRKDAFNYFPSNNPLADLGPIQQETVQQNRTLLNAGLRTDLSYIKGIHNIKIGAVYEHTFLRENNRLGVVDPTLNSPCLDAGGNPINGFTDPSQCPSSLGYLPNSGFNPILLPIDLTRAGTIYPWHGQTVVKQLAMYVQDQITTGNWVFNVGIRGDLYNGLSVQRQAQPRLGASYTIKGTNTVLRASYARTMETPFNENLVLSVKGCVDPVLQAIFETLGPCNPASFDPGFRNEFHAGLQQAFGRHLVFSGDYIWKYTHNAYDFSVLGATPITFPIEWHNSKIPGFALRVSVPETHGVSAFVVMSSVAARFFNPQIGGVGATVSTPGGLPFRIDHDEKYNQTVHVQYTLPFRKSTWFGFNWRYDGGLVAGAVPCYNTIGANTGCGATSITLPNGQPGIDLSGLTYDQQFQAGLACDGVRATPTSGFTQCDANGLTSSLINIPKPNTEDDDRNPSRIAPRNLFDLAIGEDNLFHGDRYKVGLRLTGTNITNKYALYNFLSTFSGTHYVSPRAFTGQISFNF
jgi:Carboxypeptidase regulatory-like domain